MNQQTTSSDIVDKLKQASDGLQCMSEADYPFEVFQWKAQEPLTAEKVIQQTGQPSDTPVKVVPLDDFFQSSTQEQDWYEQEEKETVAKFKALVGTLKTNLTDLQVYKLGTTEIDVYIVGKTSEGYLAGLLTKVIET